jgi:iron complex outermembrane receptor protein
LLTAAYFDIDRASAYLNSANLFVQDGIASYKGFEVSLSGELTEHLSIYLGAMSLDAVQASGSPAVVGKRIENTPKRSGSVFLEYRIPTIEGLSVSAGAFYTGDRAINATNSGFVPAYTTFDLGASYETKVNKRDLAFRLYLSNVADKDYWAATGASLLQQGAPRTITLTVSTSF